MTKIIRNCSQAYLSQVRALVKLLEILNKTFQSSLQYPQSSTTMRQLHSDTTVILGSIMLVQTYSVNSSNQALYTLENHHLSNFSKNRRFTSILLGLFIPAERLCYESSHQRIYNIMLKIIKSNFLLNHFCIFNQNSHFLGIYLIERMINT